MCQGAVHHEGGSEEDGEFAKPSDDFPWDAGVTDAHCHPTDTMSSIASLASMRAQTLTIMATRAQDQELVESVAGDHGLPDGGTFSSSPTRHVIPSFGWHPWFSYQLYDDTASESERTFDATKDLAEEKARHYAAVLAPSPTDKDFVESLPEPTPLSTFIDETRRRLLDHPLALVGEIGLDRAFRLPQAWTDAAHSARDPGLTPGGREGRLLAQQRVKMDHQVFVMKKQLALAGELGRAVSVHGVQAHGVVFDTLAEAWKGHEKKVASRRQKKVVAPGAEDFSDDESEDKNGGSSSSSGPPRICLHSFGGSDQMLKQYLDEAIPARIFFSFSVAVNFSTPAGERKTPDVIRACPDDRILVESDLHTAGERMDGMLEAMYRKVCEIKGWELREGVERIRKNYEDFIFG
ncbi:MAG: TatD family hydrolase [Thaumarchaeota archaeon]|nr:TatD family hydrolase [Nitrososphaerota archaeon]